MYYPAFLVSGNKLTFFTAKQLDYRVDADGTDSFELLVSVLQQRIAESKGRAWPVAVVEGNTSSSRVLLIIEGNHRSSNSMFPSAKIVQYTDDLELPTLEVVVV